MQHRNDAIASSAKMTFGGKVPPRSMRGPVDAVEIFERLGAARAIPVHWGTFRLSYEAYDTPPKLLDATMKCAGLDPARFAAVAIGAAVEVPAYAPPPSGPAIDRAALLKCLATPAVRALDERLPSPQRRLGSMSVSINGHRSAYRDRHGCQPSLA